ncbi:MAG: hypothetical protein IKX36_06940 [Prevotella sp.]|nr:hypothetical protein [Prevotella sp.]
MKKTLMMGAIVMMTTTTALAQRIQVVDDNGDAVPCATVMTTDAVFIGTTDLDGIIADVKGAKTVVITHVAYKPMTVAVDADGQKVTLEDAVFDLPELVVTKKDYTYLQVYYRIVGIAKDGVLFYRAGLVDNFYNEEKDKQDASKQHVTKAKNAGMKMGANIVLGFIIDDKATIHTEPLEERLLQKYKSLGLEIVSEGGGKKSIIDNYGTLGSITDQNGQRRIIMDENLAYLHQLEAEGKTKKLEKEKRQEAKVENAVRNSYCAYSIDENGNYRPEDFLAEQHLYSGDFEKHGHCVFIMDFFATDRGYYSKEGMKQVKKDNKVKMTYEWAQQFELQHNIPALAPEILAKVKQLAEDD